MKREDQLPFWTASLPHGDLDDLCRAALAGDDPSDAYLSAVADLAWTGALAAVGERLPTTPHLKIMADGESESAALSTTSDRSI